MTFTANPKHVIKNPKWRTTTINTGRNAAKRAARARIYKGPAKTAKGRRGK